MNQEHFIQVTEEYFTTMKEIHPEIQPEVKRQLERAVKGNQEAKEILARQLETHLKFKGMIPTETLYPNVPVYLSLIYRTFGQMVLDATLFQSPFIENIWLFENRPVQYTEYGQLKTYPYIPSSDEMEVLLTELSHIVGGTIHAKRSVLSGDVAESKLRVQMYCPPRSIRTIIARKPDAGYLTLDTLEMNEGVQAFIRQIANSKASLFVAGGMDTGKTTLVRAIILEKDPDTNTLTIIEPTPELRVGERWGKVVIEQYYVEEESLEQFFGRVFRNSTRSVALGEMFYGIEAHYVLQSALRAPGFTFTTLHLKVVSPEAALRTFETLVYQYRQSDREGIRRDIADGIEFVIMLDKEVHTGRRFISSIFSPIFDEDTKELKANHLVYWDEKSREYVWTGKKIPENKRRLFENEPGVDLSVLQQLGVW